MLPRNDRPRIREGALTRLTLTAVLILGAAACTDEPLPTGTPAPTGVAAPGPRAFPRTPSATVVDVDRRTSTVRISVSDPSHVCAVESDDSIICWGGQLASPFVRHPGPYSSVAAGMIDDCAIRRDGTIHCLRGSLTPPAGTFSQLSVGEWHACAVRFPDQTVACWFHPLMLQLANHGQATPPEGTFTMVDAGVDHTCGIRTDNTHECWGNPASSDIDPDSDNSVPDWPGTFYRVSVGRSHTCAINTDFRVRCGGSNSNGQRDHPTLSSAVEVAAGGLHSCAIASSSMFCWGLNTEGNTEPPPGQYLYVSASTKLTCAVTVEQNLRCWGTRDFFATSVPYELGEDLATATSIAIDPRPSTYGTNVTMTATVTVPSRIATDGNFAEVPSTGRVMFIKGGTCAAPETVLAAGVAIAAGSASFSTAALGVGSHAIGACYLGGDGLNASGDGAILEVNAAPTTTALTLTPTSQQYSDKVTLEATVTPASVNGTATAGSVQFTIDNAPVGSAVAVGADGKATLPNVQMTLKPASGSYAVGAQFTPTDQTLFQGSTATAASVTVTKEDASIVYSADNTTAIKVTTSGGTLAANALVLEVGVKESEPDAATSPGATGVGSKIGDVGLTVTLLPIGPGSTQQLSCSATGVSGTGYATTRNFTCRNSAAALPVNVYAVQATLTSDYYQATQYEDVVTVYDPAAGFVTGGGSFRIDGDLVRFGVNLKYKTNSKGSSTVTQGSVFAVRHHANGRKSRFSSNALNSAVAIGEDLTVPMGWAVLSGKATYTTWDAAAKAEVTLGGQAFTVYVEDRGEPGAGLDRVWMGGPGVLKLPGTSTTARTNAVTLTGGNVAVPHKSP